jgi:4-alpha-glucanotransferase
MTEDAAGPIGPALAELAAECRVATTYLDWSGKPVPVAPATVRQVLRLLGYRVDSEEAAAAELADLARRNVPGTVLVTAGVQRTLLVPNQGRVSPRRLRFELVMDGEELEPARRSARSGRIVQLPAKAVDGHIEVTFPADLPLGYHRLDYWAQQVPSDPAAPLTHLTVIVAPDQLPLPGSNRCWGWMIQLYAVRSAGSWGMGDFADLAEIARWAGEQGAELLLINPLHAAGPTFPQQNSPYSPVSRRFTAPIYLRPQDLPEYLAASPAIRAEIDRLAVGVPAGDRVDRDVVWAAKLAALELLFPLRVARRDVDTSPALEAFATWCALAEQVGSDWHDWPEELRDPQSPTVAAAQQEQADRIEFFRWLQHCCDEQLAVAQEAARDAGMPIGIVHDLAVGVDPAGADGWALQDVLLDGVSVGAPPDSFNQQGQNWGLPPWRPDRLAETGFAAVRAMVAAAMRRGGGLRVDHILGLFRLWWVPSGGSAADGTFVQYDAEVLLGILALEAQRAGALVIGEDLGTVADTVLATLSRRQVLGSSVLWFERDDPDADTPRFLPADQWRALTAASLSTHDLPTAAGFLAAEHVRIRGDLGVLGRPRSEEAASAARERAALLARLVADGYLAADALDGEADSADTAAAVTAMHALVAATPARVMLAQLADAVGDLRQPNLPGTIDEYPNWRLPIADAGGRPMTWEELTTDPRPAALARLLRAARPATRGPDEPER